jgi:hypothetical protein
MSSVYSLSGVANSNESWPYDVSSLRPAPAPNSQTAGVGANPASDDPKDTSTIPALSKVEVLKGTNPSEFQQVVSDAVNRLKVAARETSDPFAAGFLWNLANQFQMALDSGQGISPQQTAAAATASGPEAA